MKQEFMKSKKNIIPTVSYEFIAKMISDSPYRKIRTELLNPLCDIFRLQIEHLNLGKIQTHTTSFSEMTHNIIRTVHNMISDALDHGT